MKISPSPSKTLYKVQSLDRALDILDCFSFQTRELSLTDMAKTLGLNTSTAKRLIANLHRRGYLQQDPLSKRYRLGLRLFELGGIVFSSFSLRQAAAHPMSGLQQATGATVLLGVVMDDHFVYLDKREGQGMLRISSDIGWRRPLSYGMLGMVLIAYLPADKVKEVLTRFPLTKHTPSSITDLKAFHLRLDKIRRAGYVVEREEAVEGIIGIAAPIRDFSRQVVAALGVARPMGQQSSLKRLQPVIDLVKKTSDEISANMGYLKI